MDNYYSKMLSSERLRLCYENAPARIQQYLREEILHAADFIKPGYIVLELGCGYGRVLKCLSDKTEFLFGIDTSLESLFYARGFLDARNCPQLIQMNAARLGFTNNTFDIVLCLQNGVSAFKIDPVQLIKEAARVTRPGGSVLFSTYTSGFWDERLGWFEQQAAGGLIGEIDYAETGKGTIVCKDGFKATTFTPDDFISITSRLNFNSEVYEVDGSSLFCKIDL